MKAKLYLFVVFF